MRTLADSWSIQPHGGATVNGVLQGKGSTVRH